MLPACVFKCDATPGAHDVGRSIVGHKALVCLVRLNVFQPKEAEVINQLEPELIGFFSERNIADHEVALRQCSQCVRQASTKGDGRGLGYFLACETTVSCGEQADNLAAVLWIAEYGVEESVEFILEFRFFSEQDAVGISLQAKSLGEITEIVGDASEYHV